MFGLYCTFLILRKRSLFLGTVTYVYVNRINLLQIPARDAYAYGRSVLEALFNKEDLLWCSPLKIKKTLLEKEKAELMNIYPMPVS